MELPRRPRGDELLRPGELTDIRRRLRRISPKHDLVSVVAYAFDRRTRMLPFYYADKKMSPAGPRAIGAAMADAGFARTRVVLQQWNPGFRPSRMRLDGQVPDAFMVSSIQLHTACCQDLIRDACRIGPARRPLIIAGGPKFIYEPWAAFNATDFPHEARGGVGADGKESWSADVAVTGEEYVLLSLLEVVLSVRARGEPLRSAFLRARDEGMLDDVPGLVYARTDARGVPEELIDTGPQRLVGDLDELPHPVLGYALLEPPSLRAALAARALQPGEVRRHSRYASLVLTAGCKFACPYCPIPAYNQRQHRLKSGGRIADEMVRLHKTYGIRSFFGADDNFFNDRQRAVEICQILAAARIDGEPLAAKLHWSTEATVHDTLKMREHLPLARRAGLKSVWLGVEDMTATLVRKGQSVDKTLEAFRLLSGSGICPMAMLMHHDGQPLYTRGRPYGLLNQAGMLRRAGAVTLQALMVTPAPGSRLYEQSYASGQVYDSAAGRPVEWHMLDGNYVAASRQGRPWRKQFNLMAAYLYFYNPVRLALAFVRPKSLRWWYDGAMQAVGIWGLVKTVRRTLGWALRLMRGPIRRRTRPPGSALPMRSPRGERASHATPYTPAPVAKGGYVPAKAESGVTTLGAR